LRHAVCAALLYGFPVRTGQIRGPPRPDAAKTRKPLCFCGLSCGPPVRFGRGFRADGPFRRGLCPL